MSVQGERQALLDKKSDARTNITAEGKAKDELLDQHGSYVCSPFVLRVSMTNILLCSWEFGGPVGVTAMMIGFPLLMYYLWICCWFYDGTLAHPTSVDDIVPFLHKMWEHVRVVSH
jgi:Delta24(24(1))-sterol reductase